MRILFSIHHTLDSNAGAPGVTCRLADALRRRGHIVDVLSFERIHAPDRYKCLFYPWFVASYISKHPGYDVLDLSSGDGWAFSVVRSRRRKIRQLVIARSHGLEHLAHEALLTASRSGAERLSWKYPIYHGGFRLWECRMSFARADAALFLNGVDLNYAVERLGVSPHRAVRVRNGVADCFIDNARRLSESVPPMDRPRNIAFIGRYTPMKGSRCLRLAMTSILMKNPTSVLGLFGTMVDRSVVLADYPKEVHDRILVVPNYDNEDLPGLLPGYHILAFPSLSEGFSIAPLEAMACGVVPVVAATPGPMSYMQDGRNGMVVPAGDACSLERAIERLLRDSHLWSVLRTHAFSTALEYSWDTVALEMEQIYEHFAIRPGD